LKSAGKVEILIPGFELGDGKSRTIGSEKGCLQ